MTDAEMRVAIAEACPELGWWKDHEGGWHFKNGALMHGRCPLNDLNAMHEAENHMIETGALITEQRWQGILQAICGGTRNAFRATARQRAEAFLKTIGKL